MGDHVRLRFVHEIKTGAKTYKVYDWVSITTDIKDYGIKNPELFNEFYEEIKTPVKDKSEKLGVISATAQDSAYFDRKNQTATFYGKANLTFNNSGVKAEYIRIDEKKNMVFAGSKMDLTTPIFRGLPLFVPVKPANPTRLIRSY
jgi:DNA-binding GntR family transcriptional regulator